VKRSIQEKENNFPSEERTLRRPRGREERKSLRWIGDLLKLDLKKKAERDYDVAIRGRGGSSAITTAGEERGHRNLPLLYKEAGESAYKKRGEEISYDYRLK